MVEILPVKPQGSRLENRRLPFPQLERRPRQSGQVAVPGGVDKAAAPYGLQATLGGDQNFGHPGVPRQGVAERVMVQQGHPRLLAHGVHSGGGHRPLTTTFCWL